MRTTPEENAALVRRFLTDVVVGGDTDAVDVFLADDIVDHNLVFGGDRGRERATELCWQVLAGEPPPSTRRKPFAGIGTTRSMREVPFADAESYEPDEGWRRVSLAGSDAVSLEWFEKPPGHASPMHDHENEQVCLVLDGELVVHTETESVALGQYDSVLLESNESHRVVNETDELAVGVDVFAPGRSFDFWTDREG